MIALVSLSAIIYDSFAFKSRFINSLPLILLAKTGKPGYRIRVSLYSLLTIYFQLANEFQCKMY